MITIIVLLILAGISIAMLMGENGILSRATETRQSNDLAQIEERIKLAYYAAIADGKGNLTEDNLDNALEAEFGNGNYSINKDGNNKVTSITVGEVTVPIDRNVTTGSNPSNPTEPDTPTPPAGSTTVVNYTGITPGTTVNYTANGMTTADGGTPTWEVLYANGTDLYIITKEKCLSPDNTINFGNGYYSEVLTDTNGTAYSGTNLINSEPVQKGLMSEMVTFLSNSSNIITNASAQKNIQATNYMLDTAKWSGWAMGGPTLELLCMAYNQLYNLSSVDAGYKWPTVIASTSVGYASILEESGALGEESSQMFFITSRVPTIGWLHQIIEGTSI